MDVVAEVISLSNPDWAIDFLSVVNGFLIVMKRIIAFLGSSIILVGALYALFHFLVQAIKHPSKSKMFNFDLVRLDLVRTITLGLEFIIAADVIETVTAPDYYSLGIVAAVVLIRTFLTYSLHKELEVLSDHQQKDQTG